MRYRKLYILIINISSRNWVLKWVILKWSSLEVNIFMYYYKIYINIRLWVYMISIWKRFLLTTPRLLNEY